MLDLGLVQQFLRIQVIRDRPNRRLFIHQKPYIESVLRRFQMDSCNTVSTPMEPNKQLSTNAGEASELEKLEYQQAIGSVMYIMLATRPDLAYTVSTLSLYCSNPGPEHAIATQRVFRYLKKTVNTGIAFEKTEHPAIDEAILKETKPLGKGLNGLIGFTDSDWARDKELRRSTSGYLFTLYRGAISWKSARQKVVATSSTEAEYIACSEAAKEGLWLRRIMMEIGREISQSSMEYSHEASMLEETQNLYPTPQEYLENPTTQLILADNQGAIKLSKNPQYHSRTKHIDIRYHFIRDSC